jgi:deazaflavin-dependent oxidoreductase (nitroreductase family)
MPWPAFMRHQQRFNGLALRYAGRLGSLADLEHVGRRSGTTRHTPVRAFRRGTTVAVGANFGAQSHWVRNVLAAGECRMTLHGDRLRLTEAQLVPLAEAAWVFPWWFRLGLRRLVHTDHCLLLRAADGSGSSAAR